jgi:two-component system, cell cycle sensor histidine kinase and response regulator CckA
VSLEKKEQHQNQDLASSPESPEKKNSSNGTAGEEACDSSARALHELAAAQLAAIIDSSGDAIISKSPEGVIQTWNEAAENLYGYAAEEVVGRPMMSLLPKSLIGEEKEILQKVGRGECVRHLETVRIHKSGCPVPVSLTVSPIRNDAGEIVGVSHIARDISESTQLKRKLQVTQKMEALGRLAGGVAHDFNNLLTIITGYASLLQDSLKDDPGRSEMLSEVIGAAGRATDLTRQLLAFSRREAKQLQPVDLNEVIGKMQAMLRRLIGEDIEIRAELGQHCRKVLSDSGQIGQILINLAANARDAMPGGGVIAIQTENWAVDDLYHRELGFNPGNYVRMLFSDTGKGMDAETQAHIFEPFFTTKEVGKGTGLGLSTVYGIVKQNGGQISVYSQPGKGTTFAIYLPCSATEQTEAEHEQQQVAKGRATILLVEDEPSLRKLAHSILSTNGYTVLAAGNAEEALLLSEQHSGVIDLLLTDIVMPGENGQRVASRISKLRPTIRVVFMSGYSDHATLELVLSDSGSAFLQKPFTPVQLLRKVSDALAA